VPPRSRPSAGRHVVCAGIHMSDIPSFPTSCCGASARCARSPTSPARDGRSSSRWPRAARDHARRRPYALDDAPERSRTSATARSSGAAVVTPQGARRARRRRARTSCRRPSA
jgi:hypothetical protein